MKNTLSITVSFFLIFAIVFTSCKTKYEEFEPISFNGEVYRSIKVDSTFYRNLRVVFNYYNVNYKVDENGKVLVQQEIINDKDIRFNYTKKALDSSWLKTAGNRNFN